MLQEIYTHTKRDENCTGASAGELLLLLLSERDIQMRDAGAPRIKRKESEQATKVEPSLKVVKVNPFLAARDAG